MEPQQSPEDAAAQFEDAAALQVTVYSRSPYGESLLPQPLWRTPTAAAPMENPYCRTPYGKSLPQL